VGYADVDGNIGYWVTGRTPIRARGKGDLPAEGWSGEYEWSGEIPFEEMPHALNPAKGYLVSCNNRPVPADYPYFLGNAFMNGYRARRLSEMIESKTKISPADCQQMQLDLTCLPGMEFVRLLQGFSSPDADVTAALELLRAWDGKLSAASAAGAVYEVARYTLVVEVVQKPLGDRAMAGLMGGGFNPVLFPDSELYGNDTQVLFRILETPDSWWLQQAGGRQALLERALKRSVLWLREKLGPDSSAWQWGSLHTITFAHPLGAQKPLDLAFNRGPFPLGGDTDTPWQSAMAPNDPYDNKIWAPSMRHIYDMGDLSRSQFVLPIGQSGQLGSAHYDDMIQRWLGGELCPMLWTREQVEANLEGRLDLSPLG
jgi:penicillin G amidase